MRQKIRILYVSAEIAPYANVGGLGEVARSFPKALVENGEFEVVRVMPLYKNIKCNLRYVTDFSVPMDQGYETCVLKQDMDEKTIPTYFIANDRYYCREQVYSYEDDGFRFFFFCQAVLQILKKEILQVDIVHTNDWHTGFLPLLIKKELPQIKSVYTIHNISYHGFIPVTYLKEYLTDTEKIKLGYPQWLNFMKAGILYADIVTAVSPGYAEEILQEENSHGMSELLKARKDSVVGILNGIDDKSYSPVTDSMIAYPYDINHLEQKKKNRTFLRNKYGLVDEDIPLIAMVTRLDYSKGIDILLKAISYSKLNSYQLIILGSGRPYYHGILSSVSKTYGNNIVVDFHYREELAKQIYAAADIYLMPSLFEPCGLGQLYAMRYGAVPLVNPVGGLKDTVISDQQNKKLATGFHMESWSGEALAKEMEKVIRAYSSKEWKKYIVNGMKMDFSWTRSVMEYQQCYESLIEFR